MAIDLPDLGEEGEDREGLEDAPFPDLSVRDDGGDPFDDAPAADVPLEIVIASTDHEPSALGDDSLGLDDTAAPEAPGFDEQSGSLLDDDDGGGSDDEADEVLGIDPIPEEADDGGLEGLNDAADDAAVVDLPPLDGDQHDEVEDDLDLGIALDLPPRPLDATRPSE
jgi:hypothetical protein